MENLKIIKHFEIPEGTKKITNVIFWGIDTTKIESIIIPNSAECIDQAVFHEFKNLKSILIPDSVEKIGAFAFYDCKNLKLIEIPNSVKKIGFGAFDETQISWKAIPKHIYEKQIPQGLFSGMNMEGFEIPSSVTEIGDGAFYGCQNLKSIKILKTVTKIGQYAFYGCKNLKSIEIPKKYEDILCWIGLASILPKTNIKFI